MVNKGRPLITGSIRQMTGIHYAALYVRSGSDIHFPAAQRTSAFDAEAG